MAPLKPVENTAVLRVPLGIHGWEVMAPLKLVVPRFDVAGQSGIHG